MSGGVCACPQRMDARKSASTLCSVAISTLRAYSLSALKRLMTAGSSSALTGRSPKYLLEDLEASSGRVETADTSRFQVPVEVGVEKAGHVLDVGRLLLAGRLRSADRARP